MMEPELDCQSLIDLVSDYLEGTLPAPERDRFEEHVAGCAGCGRALEQFRLTVRTVGHVSEDEIPVPLRDALVDAFRAWKPSDGA